MLKKKDFPIYCFDISIKKNDVYFSIPYVMRDDDKKYNHVMKEMKLLLKKHGYTISGGGCSFNGLYDLHFTKE